jgi:hypothetical protein
MNQEPALGKKDAAAHGKFNVRKENCGSGQRAKFQVKNNLEKGLAIMRLSRNLRNRIETESLLRKATNVSPSSKTASS